VLANPPWSDSFTAKDLINLDLDKVVSEGLLMIWTEQRHKMDLIKAFEKRRLFLVENLIWVSLDPKKSDLANKLQKAEAAFSPGISDLFKSCKKTLLFFRRRLE